MAVVRGQGGPHKSASPASPRPLGKPHPVYSRVVAMLDRGRPRLRKPSGDPGRHTQPVAWYQSRYQELLRSRLSPPRGSPSGSFPVRLLVGGVRTGRSSSGCPHDPAVAGRSRSTRRQRARESRRVWRRSWRRTREERSASRRNVLSAGRNQPLTISVKYSAKLLRR